MDLKCVQVHTKAFNGIKPDADGLRKQMRVFLTQRDYTEIYLQTVLLSMGDKLSGSAVVVAGDGSDLCTEIMQKIIRICAANRVNVVFLHSQTCSVGL